MRKVWKKCQYCHKEFSDYISEQRKYCSHQCFKNVYHANKQIIKICKVCNKQFIRYKSDKQHKNAQYCSKKCSGIGRSKQIQKQCQTCKTIFSTTPAELKRGGGIYCSKKCFNERKLMMFYRSAGTIKKALGLRFLLKKCDLCSYDIVPDILQIHHIDRNRSNNTFDNILILCPNCHMLLHYTDHYANFDIKSIIESRRSNE